MQSLKLPPYNLYSYTSDFIGKL